MPHSIMDDAPTDLFVTNYDRAHKATYLRLLDAVSLKAPWHEIAQVHLAVDAGSEPERARRRYDSHLARARWIASQGYWDLLREQ